MEIRIGVTGHTLGRKPGKLPVCVATLASYIDMGTLQGEVAAIVVEGRVLPIRRIVAGSTVCAKTTAMLIYLAVTGIAIRRCALIDTILMASLTGYPGMLPFQLEGR